MMKPLTKKMRYMGKKEGWTQKKEGGMKQYFIAKVEGYKEE